MSPCFYGTIHGYAVADVLPDVLPLLEHCEAAVVRSLDSIVDARDIAQALSHADVVCIVAGKQARLSIEQLARGLSNGVFTGFDEIWLFPRLPQVDLAEVPLSTTDCVAFGDDPPVHVLRAVQRTGCALLLGDGCGLNYITNSKDVQERLEEAQHA